MNRKPKKISLDAQKFLYLRDHFAKFINYSDVTSKIASQWESRISEKVSTSEEGIWIEVQQKKYTQLVQVVSRILDEQVPLESMRPVEYHGWSFDMFKSKLDPHKRKKPCRSKSVENVYSEKSTANVVVGHLQKFNDNVIENSSDSKKSNPLVFNPKNSVSVVYCPKNPANLEDLSVFKDLKKTWCPAMVVIPRGHFRMGAPSDDNTYQDEKPQHNVTIQHRFAIGKFLVTFKEFDVFCKQTGHPMPKEKACYRGTYPVVNVSWNEANIYVKWLSDVTGQSYRLPSEAEWEYCCRAGTTTAFSFGSKITTKHANFGKRYSRSTPVGRFIANSWGLYDMHGNVWEFVADLWHETYDDAPQDGSSWVDGAKDVNNRVVRGGSYSYPAKDNRSSVRCYYPSQDKDSKHGFRVARSF